MNDLDKKYLVQAAIELTEKYFENLKDEERANLPKIFNDEGRWFSLTKDSFLAIFYLTEQELNRTKTFQEKGLHPFPAFFEPEGQNGPTAFFMAGTQNLLLSNRVSNMYALKVNPGTSFIIIDHFQEVTLPDGKKIEYKVDFAFVLGLLENEGWNSIEKRLLSLIEYSVSTWRELK